MEDLVVEKILWSIVEDYETNLLQAYYIDLLIRVTEKRINKKLHKILDVACGTGRLHKYLRELGYEVYGIDINPNFIKGCKEKFPEFEKNYFVEDMRNIKFKDEFDIVLSWFNSFSYFSHEENVKVLKNFYNALKKDGILILDTTTAGVVINKNITTELYFANEIRIDNEEYILLGKSKLKRTEYGYKITSNISVYRQEDNNTLKFIKELKHQQILYYPEILIEMIKNVGFEILYTFSGRSINNYINKIESLISKSNITIVAKK